MNPLHKLKTNLNVWLRTMAKKELKTTAKIVARTIRVKWSKALIHPARNQILQWRFYMNPLHKLKTNLNVWLRTMAKKELKTTAKIVAWTIRVKWSKALIHPARNQILQWRLYMNLLHKLKTNLNLWLRTMARKELKTAAEIVARTIKVK